MRNFKKILAAAGLTAGLTAAGVFAAFGGAWVPEGDSWRYQNDDGSYKKADWLLDNGVWYYFDENGYMKNGGWITVGGKQYYLTDTGAMLTDTDTPDGYRVDASGARTEQGKQTSGYGWQQDANGWWYMTPTGDYIKDKWKTIDGKRYYFDENGYILTGLQNIDGLDYYFDENGVLVKKDFVLDGEYYVVEEDGSVSDIVDRDEYYEYYRDRASKSSKGSSSGKSRNSDSAYSDSGSSSFDQPDGANYEYALQVVDIVNKERTSRSLDPLEISDDLMDTAQFRAEEIVGKYSHTRPDSTSWWTVLDDGDVAFATSGENIAEGISNPKAVMAAWMKSSGHKENILAKRFGKIGVGCYIQDGVAYWCQHFTD